MILKIQTSFSDSPNGESYWMLDDIRKIHKTGVFLKKDIPTSDSFDITLFNNSEEPQYVELICRREDTGTEFVLVTDNVGYILNDLGKTIEKILPKY